LTITELYKSTYLLSYESADLHESLEDPSREN